jgi:hypothetical protein
VIYAPLAPPPDPAPNPTPPPGAAGPDAGRWALGLVGGAFALAVAAWVAARLRRAVYLRRARPDREVENRVLLDRRPSPSDSTRRRSAR